MAALIERQLNSLGASKAFNFANFGLELLAHRLQAVGSHRLRPDLAEACSANGSAKDASLGQDVLAK